MSSSTVNPLMHFALLLPSQSFVLTEQDSEMHPASHQTPSLAPALSIVPICSVAAQGEVFGILGILHIILDLFGPAFGLRVTNLVTIFGIFPVRDIFPLRTWLWAFCLG